MPLGLLALAVGGFGIGLTEFVIMGLLPELAQEFRVNEAVAGLLISGYALSVGLGGTAMTAGVIRFNRKNVLLGLMMLFITGNFLCAIAPNYGLMMTGRIIAALCHGAFFGIGSVVAINLVAPEKKAGAIATMFAGLTTATVLGVPFGTLLGQNFGWRATFAAITAIGIIALVGLFIFIPNQDATGDSPSLSHELQAFRNPQVWLSIVITILSFGGMFGAFTYVAYILTNISGFASTMVPWLLVLFGAGMFIGNIVGGKAADKSVSKTLFNTFIGLIIILVAFAFTARSQAATLASLFLMGAFGFGTVPALQMRIMQYAAQAPTLASGANIAAFNLGNALGAWLGGVTITAGLGYTSPIWAGSALTFSGLLVLVLAERLAARQTASKRHLEPERANVEAAACPFQPS